MTLPLSPSREGRGESHQAKTNQFTCPSRSPGEIRNTQPSPEKRPIQFDRKNRYTFLCTPSTNQFIVKMSLSGSAAPAATRCWPA